MTDALIERLKERVALFDKEWGAHIFGDDYERGCLIDHRDYQERDAVDVIRGTYLPALQSQAAEIERLKDALRDAETAIRNLPDDALGTGTLPDGSAAWFLKDELLGKISAALKDRYG